MMAGKIKRFYENVAVVSSDTGFLVELDGRAVKSPAGAGLYLPNEALAFDLAGEYGEQGEFIELATMPMMNFAALVTDMIEPDPQAARDEIGQYASSDLLCYRAEGPQSLVDRQSELWDPVLLFFKDRLNVDFRVTSGIRHIAQADDDLQRFEALLAPLAHYELGAVHQITKLTGSAALALALQQGELKRCEVWQLAHVDEDFQVQQWGEDEEAQAVRQRRLQSFNAAARVL